MSQGWCEDEGTCRRSEGGVFAELYFLPASGLIGSELHSGEIYSVLILRPCRLLSIKSNYETELHLLLGNLMPSKRRVNSVLRPIVLHLHLQQCLNPTALMFIKLHHTSPT